MEDQIFDISFSHEGTSYKGWVNPSDKLNEQGKPISFHVVLNDTSFGYLSYNSGSWQVNEQRPAALIELVGAAIEQHYSLLEDPQQ